MNRILLQSIVHLFILHASISGSEQWLIPLDVENRTSLSDVRLTKIGHFGRWRVARPTVPGHCHTAVDMCRPEPFNYDSEPILPIAHGKVISVRDDGAYAQIIITHGDSIWSVYEHVAGVEVQAGDIVSNSDTIARFMNSRELEFYGRHFDHLHLEIMKKQPYPRDTLPGQPDLHFGTYALTCYSLDELKRCYFNPLEFLQKRWNARSK